MFLTPLIGRERDVEQAVSLLASSRLVSLVGPGGTGKTRLAAAVASALEAMLPLAAWVDLSGLEHPAMVPLHVAATLGLREHPACALERALVERLGGGPFLLVLDNCEHLVDSCAQLAGALLRDCPQLRLLTTSREALGVAGEKAWRVPPLHVPSVHDRAAHEAPAVQLFAQRAGDVLPTFRVTDANVGAIGRICRRVDGLPLAIELAAARVAVLPPEQLAERLDDMFRLLASRSTSVSPRHRTLRGLMDWSYDLLSEREQRVFARLSVFVGGFSLEAAERVAGAAHDDVLDALAALVDKSLVTMREAHGEARYGLLDTVREYALQRLRESEAAEARAALQRMHASYYTSHLERLARAARAGDTLARTRMIADQDNAHAALGWALEADAELALRLCLAMSDVWQLRGQLSIARGATRRAIEAARTDARLDLLRARALVAAAVHGRMMGEYRARAEWLREAEAIARARGDRAVLADALTQLGVSLRDDQETAGARAHLDEALPLWRAAGDARGLSMALGVRASIALAEGEPVRARALRAEAAEVARAAGDREGEAYALIGLGEVARMEGRLDEARACNERCLVLFDEIGDTWHAAAAYHNLGWIEAAAGRTAASFAAFRACAALFPASGNPYGLMLCVFGFARLLSLVGDQDAAAVVLAAASAHAARYGARPAPADAVACEETRAGIESVLSDVVRARAAAEGAAMTLAEVAALAQERLRARVPQVSGPAADAVKPASGPKEPAVAGPAARPALLADTETEAGGAAPAHLRVRALGPLQIFVQGEPLDGAAFGSSRPRELLLLLLCNPAGLTREQVGLVFWPDASAAQVKNSFHVMLHRLRRALGHADWVVLEGERYRLTPGLRIDFDAERVEAALQAALRAHAAGADDGALLEAALAGCTGEFLEDTTAGDWHLDVRERLRRLHLAALLARAATLLAADRIDDAAEAYRAVLARDRLQEEALRGLMTCHARSGQRVQALRLYDAFATLLREELGIEPDVQTAELHGRVQRAEPL